MKKSFLIIAIATFSLGVLFAQTGGAVATLTIVEKMKAASHDFTLMSELNPGQTGIKSGPLMGKKTGEIVTAEEYNRILELFAEGISLKGKKCESGKYLEGFDKDGIMICTALPKETIPATSCKAILDAGDSTGDGIYKIDTGGGAIDTYCDMTTNGGGWTLVVLLKDNGYGFQPGQANSGTVVADINAIGNYSTTRFNGIIGPSRAYLVRYGTNFTNTFTGTLSGGNHGVSLADYNTNSLQYDNLGAASGCNHYHFGPNRGCNQTTAYTCRNDAAAGRDRACGSVGCWCGSSWKGQMAVFIR